MNRQVAPVGILVALVLGALIGFAGSDGGDTAGGIKIFLLFTILSFAINLIAYVPSYLARTEHYYDLTGSITYLTVTATAFLLTETRDLRTVLLAGLIYIWALRLGSFLFARVKKAGKDGRFDSIKHDAVRFLMFWCIQALWVIFTASAALAAITVADKQSFGIVSAIGLIVWIVGFAIEVVADRQKSAFRSDPKNSGRFITTGLWAWSRHPNYFGEFTLWLGIALIALPALQGWQYVTLLSPVFVFVLLNKVSGVPALEHRANKKWGDEPAYVAYRDSTPVFFLRPPSS